MMKSSVSSFFQCFCNFTKWLEIDGSYNPGQNILGHLRKLSTKIHYCEWTHILPLIRTWECCYGGYFCSPFPLKMLTVNTTPGGGRVGKMHHFVELLCLCSKSFGQGCWLLYLTFDMHLLYFWGHNQRIMSNASFV